MQCCHSPNSPPPTFLVRSSFLVSISSSAPSLPLTAAAAAPPYAPAAGRPGVAAAAPAWPLVEPKDLVEEALDRPPVATALRAPAMPPARPLVLAAVLGREAAVPGREPPPAAAAAISWVLVPVAFDRASISTCVCVEGEWDLWLVSGRVCGWLETNVGSGRSEGHGQQRRTAGQAGAGVHVFSHATQKMQSSHTTCPQHS